MFLSGRRVEPISPIIIICIIMSGRVGGLTATKVNLIFLSVHSDPYGLLLASIIITVIIKS